MLANVWVYTCLHWLCVHKQTPSGAFGDQLPVPAWPAAGSSLFREGPNRTDVVTSHFNPLRNVQPHWLTGPVAAGKQREAVWTQRSEMLWTSSRTVGCVDTDAETVLMHDWHVRTC